jgi:ribosome modulation factor
MLDYDEFFKALTDEKACPWRKAGLEEVCKRVHATMLKSHQTETSAHIATLESQLSQAQEQVRKASAFAAGYDAGAKARLGAGPQTNPYDTETDKRKGWIAGWEWMRDYQDAQRLPHATARATAAEACLRRLVRAIALEARNPDRESELTETNDAISQANHLLAAVAASGDGSREDANGL